MTADEYQLVIDLLDSLIKNDKYNRCPHCRWRLKPGEDGVIRHATACTYETVQTLLKTNQSWNAYKQKYW